MLKVALPRLSSDAVIRGGGRPAFSDSDLSDAPVRALTREEAADLRRRKPSLSPWWVVLAQVGVGVLAMLAAWLATGDGVVVRSALWGAAVVAVPGALMARGATSRVTSASPMASTVGMMGWAVVKTVVCILMLTMAPRVVPGLSWSAMLATVATCLLTYWFALMWRGRATN